MPHFVRFLSLLVILALPAAAQTPAERERLDWVQHRGRLLFEIDRAAWVTTDDLRERLPRPSLEKVRGWTVERDETGFIVTYYSGETTEVRRALYRGRVENRRVRFRETFPPGEGPELTPMQRRLADARVAVASLGQRPCTNAPFNTAIIPPETIDGPLDLYALTAQTEATTFPFGGHYLATLSPRGEILSQRGFMRTCFNADLPRGRGQRPAMMFITHLLDPLPTEIHVFMSLSMGLPVAVGAGDRIWAVDGRSIELIGNASDVLQN